MPKAEEEKGPQDLDARLKGQLRKLMKQYHSDMGGVTGKQAEVIMKILAACRDASTSAEYGDPKRPTKWEGTWDQWRGRNAFHDEFITLVRASVDGKGNKTTEHSERAIRVPGSPREFINTLQKFVDTGELPPESARDREDKERADATAARRQRGPSYADPHATYGTRDRQQQGSQGDYGAWEQRQQEEAQRRAREEARRRAEEEQSTWRKWQRERAERAQRQQEDAARQAQEDAARHKAEEAERRFKERRERAEQQARERAERAERAKEEAERRAQEEARAKAAEEAARKAQEEVEQRERAAKERAERDAKRPENLFPRRVAEAQTLDDFRGIVKDMDDAFENQSALGPDQAFPEEVYVDLRFIAIPKRVASLFRTEVANAAKPGGLQKIFRDIVQDGFFRDGYDREILSRQGEALLSEVNEQAKSYFKNTIREAKFRSELADIGKQVEQFFGGSLSEARIFAPRIFAPLPGSRAPLSQVERSTMTRAQIRRYESGGDMTPKFTGPLSEAQRGEILRDSKISFISPTSEDAAKIVAELSDAIDEQAERLQEAQLATARRRRAA